MVEAIAGLGSPALGIVLLPSVLMYALEAYGWRIALGPRAEKIPFWRLLAIRTAGEVVNMTTPTAYVGGEPLKAYLLQRRGVPLIEGLASVVTAKTMMTLAQVGFVLVGIILSFWTMRSTSSDGGASEGVQVTAAVVSVGLLLFGTVLLMSMQRRGLFTGVLMLLRRIGIRLHVLESREAKLRALDRAILDFYVETPRAFLLSTLVFFLGWLAEALEVFAMLSYLSPPADFLTSVSIGALAVLIKGGTFFIPGSIGAQEGGTLVLLMAYGYSEVTGLSFAVLRRVRELVWILIGLLCLLMMGGFAPEKRLVKTE
jgi:uncharacterized protein (TIRG00374 family)